MRPVTLKITAFGPYAKCQYLNFEEGLADDNLFLIHGITGAGKTSILDAMLFALYGGNRIGNGRDGKMMRSEHADSATPTEVDFTFALGDKLYRVKRTISPNLQKTASELHDLNIGDEVITKNVTERIEELIGFGSEQFRQVILLQQGEFKKFLFSKTNDRQKILDVLFNAGFYKQVEERLKNKSDPMNAELQTLQENYNGKLGELEIETEEDLIELIEATDTALKQAQESLKELVKSRKEARDELEKGRALFQKFKDLEGELNKLRTAKEAYQKAESDLKTAKVEYEKQQNLESERKKLEKDIEELVKIRERLSQLQDAKVNFKSADTKAKAAAEEIKTLNKTVAAYESRLEQILKETKAYSRTAADFEKYDAKVKDCEVRDKLLKDIEAINKQIEAATKVCAEVEEKRLNQQRNIDRLKQLARLGRAAILAHTLKDGEPCPVCGSTVHPKLAVSEELIPTDEEIEQAEEELDKLNKQKSTADNKLAGYKSKLQTQQEALAQKGNLGDTEYWRQKRQEEQKAKLKFIDAENNFKKGKKLLQEVKDKLKAKDEEYKNAADLASKLSGIINERENQIAEQYKADVGGSKLDAELKVSTVKLNEMNTAWSKAQNEYHQLEKQVSARNSAYYTIKEGCQRLSEQLKDKAKPNVEELSKKSDELEEAYNVQTKKAFELTSKYDNLNKAHSSIKEMKEQIAQRERDCAIWLKLSRAANGFNPQRMKFQTYILNAMFQDIIYEANERLKIMSDNRYRFEYKVPSKMSHSKFYGLDFEIYDEFTSTTRPVETLSGGESFLASLSLALGLADVVQNNAGGIKLDTIFIDEGFGSLDSDTLDLTIRALNDLKRDGRLVGIISHVEELKQQINVKLEVIKGKNGSFARFSNQ